MNPTSLLTIVAPADETLRQSVEEIITAFPWRFADAGGRELCFRQAAAAEASLMTITPREEGRIVIEYSRPRAALRALGIVMGRIEKRESLPPYAERSGFESLGIMLDVSRNAVLRLDALKALIRSFALMGIDRLMLYTEDTYEIPGEPMFGYFRGRYTQGELKEIDNYAFLFGMEVVPCIQTLGHLEQMIKWPAYRAFVDTESILLVGDEGTKGFIEKMIAAASAPFRSKRIHVGMDEADGVGSGAFRSRNGYVPPFEIMTRHLNDVVGICEKQGLSPMIWSDMFFRLGSKTNDYYDPDLITPPEVPGQIPRNVDLVYWDYAHTEQAFYSDWIARHRAMGKEPIYAGGIWTWSRLWAALPRSFVSLRAGLSAARKAGLKEAFVTLWGDDGTECDFFSALPAIQYFAEQAYASDDCDQHLEVHFKGSCNASAAAWIEGARLDHPPEFGEVGTATSNLSKWLLWHDPVLSFLDQQIPESAPQHYESLSRVYRKLSEQSKGDARLQFPQKIAAVLALKSAIHLNLRKRYRERDLAAIEEILCQTLPELKQRLRALWQCHKALWHSNNKALGWEVLDKRYGALFARLETLERLLSSWVGNPDSVIEELECVTSRPYDGINPSAVSVGYRMASCSSPFC